MRPETISLEVPIVKDAEGKAEVSDRFVEKCVQVHGLVSGEWQLRGSADGVVWDDVESSIKGNGFVIVDGTFKLLRVKCVAAPAGGDPTPVMLFSALDARSF